MTCRTMASSLLAARSASVCHRAEYISQRLYINPSVSHCAANDNDTLYIDPGREFLQRNLFNSRTCEGVQRSEGFKKRPCRQRPHTWRRKKKKKSSYLFFDDVLTLMCLTQTKQRATICCLDSAPTVITDVSSTPVPESKRRRLGQPVHHLGPVSNTSTLV